MSPTRYENRGKVRLVTVVNKHRFCQTPHSEHVTKSLPNQLKAPGTKTRQKCAWWACFEPHQVRKPGKSALGGHVLSPTRYENRGKVRLVTIVNKPRFCQTPHSEHFTKSLPRQLKAPGTKTRQKCAWWACFEPHQVRKQG